MQAMHGCTTEVALGPDRGLPRTCAVRCDFLTLTFKTKLTQFVGWIMNLRFTPT